MTSPSDDGRNDKPSEASDWWSRMHSDEAEQHRASFERWLSDPKNRAAYAALEEGWLTSAGLADTEIGRNRSLERVRSPFAITGPRLAMLATAVAAVLLVVFLRPGTQAPEPQQDVAAQLLKTNVGEIRTVNLPDGSKVTLDTDSMIRIRFAGNERRVELVGGRARFDVRPDPARNFILDAGHRTVSLPEGRFDASLLPQGLCVSAWRGTLDIRSGPDAHGFQLISGRTVILGPGIGPADSRAAEKGREQWVAGMLVYKAAPLAEVLAETNRYSPTRIILGDPELGQLRVTGTFRPVPVDELAASLAAAFSLRVTKARNGDLILNRA